MPIKPDLDTTERPLESTAAVRVLGDCPTGGPTHRAQSARSLAGA